MGYCVERIGSNFYIAAGNKEAAYKALKNMDKRVFVYQCENESMEGLIKAVGWTPITDVEGNVIDIVMDDNKLDMDKCMFNVLAPFVREGSFIRIFGEDGMVWEWLFEGGFCKEYILDERKSWGPKLCRTK